LSGNGPPDGRAAPRVGVAAWLSGPEAKIVTGIDDHSRFIVCCHVVARAVCTAFAHALKRYGVPGEVLTDNGKWFTGKLTQVRSPTRTGKIERCHGSLRRELLDDQPPFASATIPKQ
jgi:transposase InsO family protein